MFAAGMMLFRIGQVLGYFIKFKTIIIGALPVIFTFLRSAKAIVALIVLVALLGTGAYGYIQHKKYVGAVETSETYLDLLEQRDMELELIKEDAAAKQEILSTLNSKREYYEWKITALNTQLSDLLRDVSVASTPEEHQEIQEKVSKSIQNSYNCIMKASGNNEVNCNE